MLREASEQAGEYGISLAIENHQDFTSDELMELCETTGANVGVCLDTGNALSVGEDPVSFARTIAPRVKHVHFKDYQVHWSDEGYRLVRCAIGDGVIPFSEIATVLRRDAPLTVGVEIGALAARHIRVLTPQWWNGYPSRPHDSVWAALAAARVRMMDEHEDWRTPWEKGEIPEAIVAYEMDQLRRSVTYVKGMAL
jgi:hypothetical protein